MSLTAKQLEFAADTAKAAEAAGHIFPAMAAAEAALESAWGQSYLAVECNNLFGMKQHVHPVYGTVVVPTHEFVNAMWKEEKDSFVQYPDRAACFADRMKTLRDMSTTYPHYCMALIAGSPEEYVREVSQKWSTDPARAEKCIAIYQEIAASEVTA